MPRYAKYTPVDEPTTSDYDESDMDDDEEEAGPSYSPDATIMLRNVSGHSSTSAGTSSSHGRSMPSSLGKGRACLKCRSRKMRCDGNRPKCASCSKANRDCIYDEERSRTKKLLDKIEILQDKLALLQDAAKEVPKKPRKRCRKTSSTTTSPTTTIAVSTTSSTSPVEPTPSPLDAARLDSCKASANIFPTGGVKTEEVDLSGDWWLDDHPPQPIQDFLISTCLSQRVRPGLLIHVGRFLDSVHRPSTENPPPALSLLNAMYLMGCHLPNDPQFTAVEAIYLARTRKHLSEELGRPAARLTQWIQASCLLSYYLVRIGRFMEARHEISGTVQIVIACNMHKIKTSAWSPPPENPLAPDNSDAVGSFSAIQYPVVSHPRDSIELLERIGLFWTAYGLDHYISILCGLPPSKWIENEIETVWPRTLEGDPGCELQPPDGSVSELFGPKPAPPFDPPCSMWALRLKAMALLARVTRFATSCTAEQAKKPEFRLKFQEYHYATFVFHEGLPPVTYDPETAEVKLDPQPTINLSLFMIHTMSIVAFVHLYGALNIMSLTGNQRDNLYARRLAMCRRAVVLVRVVTSGEIPVTALPASCGFFWCAIARVLAQHFRRLSQTSNHSHPSPEWESTRRDLDLLMDATAKMSPAYPMLEYQLRRTRQCIDGEEEL